MASDNGGYNCGPPVYPFSPTRISRSTLTKTPHYSSSRTVPSGYELALADHSPPRFGGGPVVALIVAIPWLRLFPLVVRADSLLVEKVAGMNVHDQ